mgnify:CR=1 FL=1
MDPIFDTVWKEGLEEGTRNGISAVVETYQEFHRTREELLNKLMEKFSLTKEEATGYIQQYWI